MKYQGVLALCVMLQHALAEHWEFGVDPPDSEVLDKRRGEIPILETIIYIELDVPKCYQIDFVSVNVHNLISNPITTFDKHSNTVVIMYKPWQISSSTYDVVAKGTRKAHCRQPLLIKGRYEPTGNTLKQIKSHIGSKLLGIESNTNEQTDSSNDKEVETVEKMQNEIDFETKSKEEFDKSETETYLESKIETEAAPAMENIEIKSAEEVGPETIPNMETIGEDETQIESMARAEVERTPEEEIQAATELTKLLLNKLQTIANGQTNTEDKVSNEIKEYETGNEAVNESDVEPEPEASAEIQSLAQSLAVTKEKTKSESDTEQIAELTSMLFKKLTELADAHAKIEEPAGEDFLDEIENIARAAKLKSKATAKIKRTIKRSKPSDTTTTDSEVGSVLSYLIPALMTKMS